MKTINNFVSSEKQPFAEHVNSFLPQYFIVPFEQMNKEKYKPVVKINDVVQEGQIIAVAEDQNEEKLQSVIHSPVPGKIEDIIKCSLPSGKMGTAAKILLNGSFNYLGKKLEIADWKKYTPDTLCDIYSEKGIINTFDIPVSLTKQIRKCQSKKTELVVVRLFDEDPSRMTDSFIAEHYQEEIVLGSFLIAKALRAAGIIYVLPKKTTIKLNYELLKGFPYRQFDVNTEKYPSGFKQVLVPFIKNELKDEKNSIFSNVTMHSLFVDPQTVLSVYEGVFNGKPVLERFIHVTGPCISASGMFKVRIGTTIKSLAQQCGGFKRQPDNVIINGKIIGSAISELDTPITKSVKSVIFDSASEKFIAQFSTCLRCGNCRKICPAGLFPDLMFRHKMGGKPIGKDLVETADLCSMCSLCNSVCLARLPLSQTIALLKDDQND